MNYSIEHDYLTGAFNRSALEHVRLALSGPLAFLMTDIDHFKHYNDTYGHIVGDQMLQKVVRVLKATFRTIDYVIRLGGDEFAIILPGCQLRDNLEPIACKVAIINERLSHPDDALPAATISAGISFGDDGYQQVLYDQADQALYAAKHSGCGVFKAYQA